MEKYQIERIVTRTNLQIGKNKNEQKKQICISFKRAQATGSPQIFLEIQKKSCRSKNADRRIKFGFRCINYTKQILHFFCGSWVLA